MNQIIQNYRTGKIELAEVPVPLCNSQSVLVKNARSLVSIGTEQSMIELGKKSLIGKARARPDLLRRFVEKAKNEGLHKTFKEALGRLDEPQALGYSAAGTAIVVGHRVHELTPGTRVACIGAGFASHAEYIAVPQMLCARIPEGVSEEEASFGMLGIIALHGIRSANLSPGARVGVMGLGLLGLLTVQMLKAYGMRVIATDLDAAKMALSHKLGAETVCTGDAFAEESARFSSGMGLDGVILTLASKSDHPIHTAVEAVRFRGRIVVVGVADIHPHRNALWEKEVELIVSRAGGAGTFDPDYEREGLDYPAGYVRWTQKRNLEEFLRLIANGAVKVTPLITHRFAFAQALEAYEAILSGKLSPAPIGVIFEYPETTTPKRTLTLNPQPISPPKTHLPIGVIGAGLFAKALMMPVLQAHKEIDLIALATSKGMTAHHTGKRNKFRKISTDYREIINDADIQSVVILTPHAQHARMVTEALEAGKHVLVEKPLCVNISELEQLISLYENLPTRPQIAVGYNRRFSPLSKKLFKVFENHTDPLVLHYRVNAGFVPPEHWVHEDAQGGGRIVGEMCHMVDMLQFVVGANPARVYAEQIAGNGQTAINTDNVVVTVRFKDGSVGSITYTGSGNRSFSRERLEVFGQGKSAILDDYRTLEVYGDRKSSKRTKLRNQDMGYTEEVSHFVNLCLGKTTSHLTPEEIFYSTKTVFMIQKALETGQAQDVII